MNEKIVIGNAVIYRGDCLSILPLLDTVNAVVTDPPYGIAYQSGYTTEKLWASGKRISGDETTAVRDEALRLCRRLCSPMLVFGSRKARAPEGTRHVLIWDKGSALGMGALDLPWKPSAEDIYVLGKGFVGKRDEGSVIYCPPVQGTAKNGRVHPNEKPVPLLRRLIKKCPEGTILDPFMGSGAVGEAALLEGRRFVGIEIEPAFFAIAHTRLERAAHRVSLITITCEQRQLRFEEAHL